MFMWYKSKVGGVLTNNHVRSNLSRRGWTKVRQRDLEKKVFFSSIEAKEEGQVVKEQRFPTWGTRTPRCTWKISRGMPDHNKFKKNTKIFNEKAH